jgi:hypothetical protein
VRSHASYITSCAFAIAAWRLRPAIVARKLSIARRSGNTLAAAAFREELGLAVLRRFFETGIRSPFLRVLATTYGCATRCCATMRDTVGWLIL